MLGRNTAIYVCIYVWVCMYVYDADVFGHTVHELWNKNIWNLSGYYLRDKDLYIWRFFCAVPLFRNRVERTDGRFAIVYSYMALEDDTYEEGIENDVITRNNTPVIFTGCRWLNRRHWNLKDLPRSVKGNEFEHGEWNVRSNYKIVVLRTFWITRIN